MNLKASRPRGAGCGSEVARVLTSQSVSDEPNFCIRHFHDAGLLLFGWERVRGAVRVGGERGAIPSESVRQTTPIACPAPHSPAHIPEVESIVTTLSGGIIAPTARPTSPPAAIGAA